MDTSDQPTKLTDRLSLGDGDLLDLLPGPLFNLTRPLWRDQGEGVAEGIPATRLSSSIVS